MYPLVNRLTEIKKSKIQRDKYQSLLLSVNMLTEADGETANSWD